MAISSIRERTLGTFTLSVRRIALWLAMLVLWVALLFGVLQIGLAAGPGAHRHEAFSICGPWGCGPTVRALVAWHGFLVVAAALPVGLAVRFGSARYLYWAGTLLGAIGAIMLITMCVHEALTWLPSRPEGVPSYFVQRCLFSIATAIDVPIIPVLLSGAVLVVAATVKRRRKLQQRNPATGSGD